MPKPKGIKCNAVTCKKKTNIIKPCNQEQYVFENGDISIYCEKHLYWLNFTQEIINGIKNSTNDYNVCGRCREWHNGKNNNCTKCLLNNKQHALKEKENKLPLKCKLIFPDTQSQCSFNHLNDKKFCEKHKHMEDYTEEMLNNLKKCKCGIWQYNKLFGKFNTCEKCRNRGEKNRNKAKLEKTNLPKCLECNNVAYENGYCGIHKNIPTINSWIEELKLKNFKPCPNYVRGCKSELEVSYNNSYCQNCLKNAREKDGNRRSMQKTKCETVNQSTLNAHTLFETINNVEDKLHLLCDSDYTIDELKLCITKYGTENIILQFNKELEICENDLNNLECISNGEISFIDDFKIERNIHKFITSSSENKHDILKDIAIELIFSIIDENKQLLESQLQISEMMCMSCPKTDNIRKYKDFIDNLGILRKNCNCCRTKQNKLEQFRNPRNRDWSQMSEETKQKKKLWKENNYDKCVLYWMRYRGKRMALEGEEYWIKNAKDQKQWRKLNPHKTQKNNENKKKSISSKLKTYKLSAYVRNIDWDLTDEFALEKFNSTCYYCGEIDKYGMVGIDRMFNNIGYKESNVVSCCEMCNFMKGECDYNTYLEKIKHILSWVNILCWSHTTGFVNSNDTLFKNCICSDHSRYKKRALEKLHVEFSLSKNEFNQIIEQSCYMCGRNSDFKNNVNGIDRIDNKQGYTLKNCLPCCNDCNKLKNEFALKDVMRKIWKTIIKEPYDEFIANAVIKCYTKIRNDIVVSNINYNVEIDVNLKQIATKKYVAKMIEIYGEDGYKIYQNLNRYIKRTTGETQQKYIKQLEDLKQNHKIPQKKQKLSKEEQMENVKLRKQKSRSDMNKKYGTDEYRKIEANKKALYRKKKKLENELKQKS